LKVRLRLKLLLVLLPFALAVALRIYPYLLTGAPWGVDSWTLMRNSNLLLSNSPTQLTGNPTFDTYNICWPAVSVFGAVASLVFGVSPLNSMPFIIPFVGSLTTFFLFVVVKKLTGNFVLASAASILFAAASFDAIFTASVTKETFALPLFMIGVLLLLKKGKVPNLCVFSFVSLGLIMAHFALAFILFLLAAEVSIVPLLIRTRGETLQPTKLLYPLIMCVVSLAYFFIYLNAKTVGISFSLGDGLSLFAFLSLLAGFQVGFQQSSGQKTSSKRWAIPIIALVIAFALLAVGTRTAILPFAPTLSVDLVIEAAPYFAVATLAAVGYLLLKKSENRSYTFLSLWLGVPLMLVAFGVFGATQGFGIVYRLFTFLFMPLGVFAASAMIKFVNGTSKIRRVAKISLSVAFVFVIVSALSFQSYAAVVENNNFLGGEWGFKPSDLSASRWVNATLPSNTTFLGDSKTYGLFQYFGIKPDINSGYAYLTGRSNWNGEPIFTYSLMLKNGYDIIAYGEPLPEGWSNKLSNGMSLVYSNGNDKLWV
jgi:hypothetical protein